MLSVPRAPNAVYREPYTLFVSSSAACTQRGVSGTIHTVCQFAPACGRQGVENRTQLILRHETLIICATD